MIFKSKSALALGVLVSLCLLNICDGLGESLGGVVEAVKTASADFMDNTRIMVENVKDSCEIIDDCLRENGASMVTKTKDLIENSVESITDIISKAKCVIPESADNIVRAMLLQQCISPSLGFGNESRCFDELGCFPMEYPWTSNLRPFPQPMTPDEVGVKLYLYTSKQPERYEVQLWPSVSIEGSDFDPERPYTAFIIHGFLEDGEIEWMSDLKDAYLKQRDANVFIVDWGKGSKLFNYLQATSNTRMVAAELIRFGKYLIDYYQLDPKSIHVMGHSLGAHISSYFGKGVPGLGRITGFDPAQPGFEGCPKEVRLDKSDARFVDVIHTSSRPMVPFLGMGIMAAVGHVDIYVNGGMIQPGCPLPPINEVKFTSIADLAAVPAQVFSSWVKCSHVRSILYFTESLENYCTFWAQKTNMLSAITNIITLGQLQPLLMKIDKCEFDDCVPIGLDTDQYAGRGVFSAGTAIFPPYCESNAEIDQFMRNEFISRNAKSQQ